MVLKITILQQSRTGNSFPFPYFFVTVAVSLLWATRICKQGCQLFQGWGDICCQNVGLFGKNRKKTSLKTEKCIFVRRWTTIVISVGFIVFKRKNVTIYSKFRAWDAIITLPSIRQVAKLRDRKKVPSTNGLFLLFCLVENFNIFARIFDTFLFHSAEKFQFKIYNHFFFIDPNPNWLRMGTWGIGEKVTAVDNLTSVNFHPRIKGQ